MKSRELFYFDRFIGVDYSGAGTTVSPQKGIAVCVASHKRQPQLVSPPQNSGRSKYWSRLALTNWLSEQLRSDQRLAIGMDHAFSFPTSYFEKYQLENWSQLLKDFVEHWPTAHPDATVEQFRAANSRTGDSRSLRITERWTAGPKSVFQFDIQGSVAKSTHAGLPLLAQLRSEFSDTLHVWPFDGWNPKPGRSVIFEVFPSLFRNRYPRENRTVDQQDAYAVCRWMKEMQRRNRFADYFDPPLDPPTRNIAKREGWIMGVM